MQILSNPVSALNVRESPKFSRPIRNRGRETRWRRQTGSGNTAVPKMIIVRRSQAPHRGLKNAKRPFAV